MDEAADAPSRFPAGILAAVLAMALAVGWLHHYAYSAQQLAERYVRVLGPRSMPFKSQTLTMQRAALAVQGVLPVYGTSELYCCGQPYNAATFYYNAPTGFSVFNVGYPVTEDLFWAETFGALGNALRGKKLVVSDSPWFMSAQGISEPAYAHTYSPEVAMVFTFDAPVPLPLRAAVARRMLDFPQTLTGQPMMVAALRDLAHGGWRSDLAYALVDPVGRLAAWQAQLQDARQTVSTIGGLVYPHGAPSAAARRAVALTEATGLARVWDWVVLRLTPGGNTPLWQLLSQGMQGATPALNPNVPTHPKTINWTQVLTQATAAATAATRTNPFGVATSQWKSCSDISPVAGKECQQALALYAQGRSNHFGTVLPIPQSWVSGVKSCLCWTDLDLEFEMLRAVQARPLAWLQPVQGFLADYTQYSAPARRVIYDRYMAIANAEGIPATTFETHDTDRLYMNSFGHMSQRGWVYADRLLNLFWHNQLGEVRANMERGGSVGILFPHALNCPTTVACEGVANVQPLPGELAKLPVDLGLPPLTHAA